MKLIPLVTLLTACTFPKDPEDSLQKVQQHGITIGIVNNPPYTMYTNNKATGTEVDIINNFARKEGINVNYVYGTESVLVSRLEHYKLHLIIGGFDKETIWKDKAGLTTTYNTKNCFLIAKGENALLYELESFLLKAEQDGN